MGWARSKTHTRARAHTRTVSRRRKSDLQTKHWVHFLSRAEAVSTSRLVNSPANSPSPFSPVHATKTLTRSTAAKRKWPRQVTGDGVWASFRLVTMAAAWRASSPDAEPRGPFSVTPVRPVRLFLPRYLRVASVSSRCWKRDKSIRRGAFWPPVLILWAVYLNTYPKSSFVAIGLIMRFAK